VSLPATLPELLVLSVKLHWPFCYVLRKFPSKLKFYVCGSVHHESVSIIVQQDATIYLCRTCNMSYIGHTIRNLTQRYREHIRYIRNNDPQSAYAQHILLNLHEYGTITDTMTLLKPIHKISVLIPYEQLFIQTCHHNGNLVTEQGRGKQNPLFQLAIDTGLTSQPFQNRSILPSWYT